MSKTYRPYEPDQILLLPPSVKDWLPTGHLAHFIFELVDESLDLSAITKVYEREDRGYPPYHPAMMTKVLLYAYCVGLPSSRNLLVVHVDHHGPRLPRLPVRAPLSLFQAHTSLETSYLQAHTSLDKSTPRQDRVCLVYSELTNRMKNQFSRRFFAVLLLALAAGCNPPKYAQYESINKDFTASVPWGWQVMTDQQDNDFSQTTFIGPFDPDFYLGAPSLSVRWYRRYRAHKLTDGRLEMYNGADDFIRQTLAQVYAPDYVLLTLDEKISYDNERQAEVIPDITLKQSGLKGKAFTVASATPAPEANKWGIVAQSGTDRSFVLRKHAYVVVPIEDGFYVLTYPATERGYHNFLDKFAGLMGSFMPRTAGPGGPKIRIPGPR